MEVKRTKTDSGYIRYTVSNSKHVRVIAPYVSSPTPLGGYVTRAIYYSRTLEGIKEVLSRFSTEEELFGAYYESRLAGKTQLF